jgi:hypothetical protein
VACAAATAALLSGFAALSRSSAPAGVRGAGVGEWDSDSEEAPLLLADGAAAPWGGAPAAAQPPPDYAPRAGHGADPDESAGACVVCQEAAADHCFVPCGHRCVCAAHAAAIMALGAPTCPMCRARPASAQRVYDP